MRHGVEHLFLVQVDEHPSLDGIPQTGALDLARLEHDIPIGQDDGRAQTGGNAPVRRAHQDKAAW